MRDLATRADVTFWACLIMAEVVPDGPSSFFFSVLAVLIGIVCIGESFQRYREKKGQIG